MARAAIKDLVVKGRVKPIPFDETVWHLNLDQIESGTGRVLSKLRLPAGEGGNSTQFFEQGTVLYSKLRPYLNKVVVADERGVATTELVPLRVREDAVIPEYLAQYLRSDEFLSQASARVTGAKMPRLILDWFWNHEIPLPPIDEQRRITHLLDEADRLQRLRKAANEKAQRILPALFAEMFGDPETNPMGWDVKTLGEVTAGKPKYGAGASAIPWTSGRPRYVRITDVDDEGRLNPASCVAAALSPSEEAAYRLEQGDVLFARSGATVGKVYLHGSESMHCVYAGYLIRFRLNSELLDPTFLFGFTRTAAYRGWVASKQRPTAQPNINAQEYASLTLPAPPIERQRAFAAAAQTALQITDEQAAAATATAHAAQSVRSRLFAESM